jgi:hypothetical protein
VDFDDIVIGSGLAALGVALGLDPLRRVLLICGPAQGTFSYYSGARAVPCAYLGEGGLGNNWHGVIPTGWRNNFAASSDAEFEALFAHFYPRSPIRARLGGPFLFVPWRPIRPRDEFRKLAEMRGERMVVQRQIAERIDIGPSSVRVCCSSTSVTGQRLWLAAGALHTPALLDKALGRRVSRGVVSDHILCYVGQVDGASASRPVRTADGVFFPARYGEAALALYTLRPARFAFRRLDYGIEQRAAFGLPTGGAIAKIARSMSPGLIAEALYNRLGLFPNAATHSIYAQIPAADAYLMTPSALPLQPDLEVIRRAGDKARAEQPFAGARLSQRADLYIPGIHLHHSLDLAALADAGVNRPGDLVQVVDASVLHDIGPDHHSFKMLVAAAHRARAVGHV